MRGEFVGVGVEEGEVEGFFGGVEDEDGVGDELYLVDGGWLFVFLGDGDGWCLFCFVLGGVVGVFWFVVEFEVFGSCEEDGIVVKRFVKGFEVFMGLELEVFLVFDDVVGGLVGVREFEDGFGRCSVFCELEMCFCLS